MRFAGRTHGFWIRTASVVIITACWARVVPAQQPVAADVQQKVDAVFSAYDRSNSPGCALAVYRDGEIVYERGYGMASLEHGVAITPRTVFDIGSTSKQFTSFSILLSSARASCRWTTT